MSNQPPKDVEPSELWRQLSARQRPTSGPIDFPSKAGSLGKTVLRILTESERRVCRANADKVARELLGAEVKTGNLAYEDIYNDELTVQILSLACRDPEDPKFPTFPSAKHARQVLTTDEFALLITAYANYRRDAGPFLSELTEPEMEAWLRVLQEGASHVPLAQLSGPALRDLIMFLVSKMPKRSEIGSGSAGSPLGELSTERPPTAADLVDSSERAGIET